MYYKREYYERKARESLGTPDAASSLFIPTDPWELLKRHAFVKNFEERTEELDTDDMKEFQRAALLSKFTASTP